MIIFIDTRLFLCLMKITNTIILKDNTQRKAICAIIINILICSINRHYVLIVSIYDLYMKEIYI